MADLRGNPWNFLNADQATTAAISSIVNQGGSILVTTSVAHSIVQDQVFSIQGTTILGWTGPYRAIAVPSGTTILANLDPSKKLLANNGANGNVLSVAYNQIAEVTQMLWDSPTVNGVLLLTGLDGRTIWNPTAVTGGTLTYMKAFPIYGLVINSLPSGTLQVSI